MNYSRIYDQFIADRRTREADVLASGVYVERHHIVPRSLGGGDEAENLITLTADDHLFAHIVLGKVHGGHLWFAVVAMIKGISAVRGIKRSRSSRNIRAAYAMARKRHAEHLASVCIGRTHSDSSRLKMSESHKGKKLPEETKRRIGKAHRGRKKSEKGRANIASAKAGYNPTWLHGPRSDSWKKAISDAQSGIPRPQTTGALNGFNKRVRRADTGEVFATLSLAAISVNGHISNLSGAIKNKKPYKKVLFEFV